MAERYSRIFTLSENLYSIGSPIIIEAGALLKDNKTGDVLAQIKMKNISPEKIKAVKVKLSLFDVSSNLLNDSIEYQYLDLDIARNESFGSKSAIKFEEPTTRSFTVNVEEVIFESSSVWYGTNNEWETLSEQSKVCDVLDDEELVKQFELKYGTPAPYVFLQEKDLWHCVCGALNKENELNCHSCERALKALKEFDLTALKIEKEQRLESERQIAEAQAERESEQAEFARKEVEKQKHIGSLIAGGSLLLHCIASVCLSSGLSAFLCVYWIIELVLAFCFILRKDNKLMSLCLGGMAVWCLLDVWPSLIGILPDLGPIAISNPLFVCYLIFPCIISFMLLLFHYFKPKNEKIWYVAVGAELIYLISFLYLFTAGPVGWILPILDAMFIISAARTLSINASNPREIK